MAVIPYTDQEYTEIVNSETSEFWAQAPVLGHIRVHIGQQAPDVDTKDFIQMNKGDHLVRMVPGKVYIKGVEGPGEIVCFQGA